MLGFIIIQSKKILQANTRMFISQILKHFSDFFLIKNIKEQ